MRHSILTILSQSKMASYKRVEEVLERGPFVPGTRAVHGSHFVYTLTWSQARARISEMNDLGWQITSVDLPKNLWRGGIRTAYRLDSKPLKPLASRADDDETPKKHTRAEKAKWFQQQFGACTNLSTDKRGDEKPLPLFAEVAR